MVFWYKSCTTLKTEPLLSGKCYSCSKIRDRHPTKMQAIFIDLKINEKLKRKIQAKNVLIYHFFFQFQHNIPLDTGPYCTQYHPVRVPSITEQAAKLESAVRCWLLCWLLPNSIKWHHGHTLLWTSSKFFKDIHKALVATANDIWLPLITKGLFLSPMKRNFTLSEKSQKKEAADCIFFQVF